MYVVLCYPFLDLRFLIEGAARPGWAGGSFATVGALGPVVRRLQDGFPAEIRADAALALGQEIERADRRLAAAGPDAKRRARRRPAGNPRLANGFSVVSRRLLADDEGHVRLEMVLHTRRAPSAAQLADRLEQILTTNVHVVREGRPELIDAGLDIARLYMGQSAKTCDPGGAAVTAQLVREGAGSPFLLVVHEGAPADVPDGVALETVPAAFDAVTCQIMKLAGRSAGVWQLWTGGRPEPWLEPVRALCKIVCQLSEVTLLSRLQQEQPSYAPYELDPQRTEHFFRVRAGQLARNKQGPWTLAAVQPVAAQHLRVAIDDEVHSREHLMSFLRRDNAGSIAQTLGGIAERIGTMPLIRDQDRERLVVLLAARATSEYGFFDRLLKDAALPEALRAEARQGWQGDAAADAALLVAWALEKKTNPARAGETMLASLLLPLLERLPLADAAVVVATISIYRLILDNDAIAALRLRYNAPSPQIAVSAAPLGPEINWQGPDEIELQSWLRPPPDFIDVLYIARAIEKAASVCLIDSPVNGEHGTGVLIASRLVLTNHHVVSHVIVDGQVLPEAATIALTFHNYRDGARPFTVTLDPAEPILAWSPDGEHDFALLKLSGEIVDAPNAVPAKVSGRLPALKDPLSILQHPEGGPMKLAPSENAVTHVDPDRGIIQYITRTGGGSSGAPCFDDSWELAALHHAERSRPFGTIREGILIAPIIAAIKKHLDS